MLRLASPQLSLLFRSFRNAQKFCVSEPKPLPVAVLPLLLALFLSGPSNQSVNWFCGGGNPSFTQPLSTCWWFCPSQRLCVLWTGSAPAGCWGKAWGRAGSCGTRPTARVPPRCLQERHRDLGAEGLEHWNPWGAPETTCNPVPIPLQFSRGINVSFRKSWAPGSPQEEAELFASTSENPRWSSKLRLRFFPRRSWLAEPSLCSWSEQPCPHDFMAGF